MKCVVENNPDIRYLIRNDEEIKVQVIRKNTLKAPVQKGDKTGTVYYMLDENIIKKLDIVAQQSVNEKTITVYLKYIMEQTLL